MEFEEKQTLQKHILKKLEEVKEQIKSLESLVLPVAPDSAIGRITRMEAIQNKSLNEAALKKSKSLLSKLERSLAAIEDPDYGICKGCDEPIPFARMMAVPAPPRCSSVQAAARLTPATPTGPRCRFFRYSLRTLTRVVCVSETHRT